VFPSPTGQPLRHKLFYGRHFRPAVAAAVKAKKLPPEKAGLRFHDLRHTAASLLVAAGAHPKAVMERMGHSDIRITMNRYAHLFPANDLALADALDATHAAASSPTAVVSQFKTGGA
jgi:integrase